MRDFRRLGAPPPLVSHGKIDQMVLTAYIHDGVRSTIHDSSILTRNDDEAWPDRRLLNWIYESVERVQEYDEARASLDV